MECAVNVHRINSSFLHFADLYSKDGETFNMRPLPLIRASLLFACAFASFKAAIAEVFTALVDLENLLHTEGAIVNTLQQYLDSEEDRLEKIKRLREEFSKFHSVASKNTEEFISNPVNAFLLVKKLTADWKAASQLMSSADGKLMVENITQTRNLRFPDEEDLTGAAIALLRLQDTYRLDTASLAKGHIRGVKPSPELSGTSYLHYPLLIHTAHIWSDFMRR